MLTSLIAVLVLLVIGFYAATIAVIGRAGVGEAKLLRSRRLALGLAGVTALALAYAIYSHPLGSDDPLNQPSVWAAKSAPPADRASAVADADAAQPVAPPASAEALAKAPSTSTPADAAATPATGTALSEPQSIPPPASAEPEFSLSASAAAMEAEMRRRRQAMPALAEEPAKPLVTSRVLAQPVAIPAAPAKAPAAAAVVAPVAPLARRSASAPLAAPPVVSRAAVVRPRVAPAAPLAYAPLTIVIHNQLGAAQQSERLALVIEGKRVASFEITEAAPAIALPIRLPRPGLLHYRIEGESRQGERLSLQGEGCISATEGARFEVRRRGSDSRRVFLESVVNG